MAFIVQVTLSVPEPVVVQVTDGGAAVTVAAVQSPHVVQVEAVSRVVPGGEGPPGANAEIVILSPGLDGLTEYLALSPEEQISGKWFVVPKAP